MQRLLILYHRKGMLGLGATRGPPTVTRMTTNKRSNKVDQTQRTRGFNMENPPKAEGKTTGTSQQIFTISSVQLQDAERRLTRGIYGVTLMCTAAVPPCVPGCWQAAQWASAALRPKSAFICVGLNLDHNSTPATWA